MNTPGKASLPVIKRLPKYYRYLRTLKNDGITSISSRELAAQMGTTASQVRQDFNCIGDVNGRQGIGYSVENLLSILESLLFGNGDRLPTILIGCGRLGKAVSRFITTAARLLGAPPGYLGHDEGGQLTDAVRRKPYCVVLLDEIEKAHPDVFNLLLQIMEDGRLTDGQGRTVDFRNAVLIMTSNAGAQQLANTRPLGFAGNEAGERKNRKEQVLAEIKNVFRPEFLNRVDEILVFNSLGRQELELIADNMLRELNQRLTGNGLSIELTAPARELLLKEGSDSKYGARPLRRALRKLVEDPLSDLFLAGKFHSGDKIIAEAADKKMDFHMAIEGAQFLLELPVTDEQTAAVSSGKEPQHGQN